jgi:vacuolar-type H+-ATPase subunit H
MASNDIPLGRFKTTKNVDTNMLQGTFNTQPVQPGSSVQNTNSPQKAGTLNVTTDPMSILSGQGQTVPVQKGAVTAPTAPAGPGQNGSGAELPDRSDSIFANLAGLGQVDRLTQAGIDAINKALAFLQGDYGAEAARNEASYGQQSTTNRGNLQTNKQTALVNAAQGRRGLFGTLASLGALNGSGVDLANRAVAQGANADLSGAAGTFTENQTGLDTSIEDFREDNERRLANAQREAEAAIKSTKGAGASKKQTYLFNLANDYGDMKQKGKSRAYTEQASALYPEIADANVPAGLPQRQTAAFTPSTLSNYLAGAQDLSVEATPASGSGLPGLVANTTKKRRVNQPIVAA